MSRGNNNMLSRVFSVSFGENVSRGSSSRMNSRRVRCRKTCVGGFSKIVVQDGRLKDEKNSNGSDCDHYVCE